MKVKGRSENVIRLCREVENRLPKHPLFDNFRKGVRLLQKQAKSKLVVTVINDLPQDKKYVSYQQLLSQFLGYNVAACPLRTNVYLDYHPSLDFRVTLPSGDIFTYSKDKRYLLERYLPEKLKTESFGEALQYIWKKYPAADDFYPLLCTLLSVKSPSPGLKVEILSPTGIENVTVLFPLGNDPAAGESYWKNFLEESLKADKVQAVSKAQSSASLTADAGDNSASESGSETLKKGSDNQKSETSQKLPSENTPKEVTPSSETESPKSNTNPKDKSSDKGSSKKNAKSSKKSSAKSASISSSGDKNSQKAAVEFADPEVAKEKFIAALDEANAYLVLCSMNDLLTHNLLGLLGRSHPVLGKNTIVVLEGDSHGLPGQQLNDLLSLSLGASSPMWMYYRSADAESFASEVRSFVISSTAKMEENFITGIACTELELAAKDLKAMINILNQEKETMMSDNITPLDDYFYYYFSQQRLNELIRKRIKEFRENFPKEKAKVLDFVSEKINAAITSEELMSILDDPQIRSLCENQYVITHHYYLDRQLKLRDNFNLQLARLYSEFEANYHIDPLELELQFEKDDPIYRYKVSFDIFERLLNLLMKSTSDLEQAKAHMMNSVLAKFQEDYIELENYYLYHFRKSMLIMEQAVQKIRKEYHKFYRESIDRKSDAFISKINGLQSQVDSINETLDLLRHSPLPDADID